MRQTQPTRTHAPAPHPRTRRTAASHQPAWVALRRAVWEWLRAPGATSRQAFDTVRLWLPVGNTLSEDAWRPRHRVIVTLLWLHAIGLGLMGVLMGYGVPHSLGEAGLIAAAGIPASARHLAPRLRSAAATFGLLTSSALLVHLTNGLTEAHFHFFVMLAVVALYQDWLPFLLGVVFVVVEHGAVGVVFPHQVYDHVEAWNDPWQWALIHAVFVVGLCGAMVAQWRFAELTQAERKRAAFTQARLAAIVTSSDDAVISTDLEGRLTSWNAGAERLFGYRRDEMLGERPQARLIPEDAETQALFNWAVGQIRHGESVPGMEIPCLRSDGALVEVGLSMSVLRAENGEAVGVSCIARDITDRKRAEAALEHQAQYDALTDLPNRNRLRDEVERVVTQAREHDGCTALLVLDLDRFKEINDTLGHDHGDLLLQEVAQRLRGAVRPSATIARLGGDEFGVLLPSTNLADTTRQVEVLGAAIREPFVLRGYRVEVAASIGIAVAPEHGADFDTLFRHADVAMYVAKREGKGAAVYSADQDFHSPERLGIVSELREAIAADALVLHYQPKFECPGGELIGVEALVRWPHPEQGLIPPDRFIPLAEQTGLIRPLTEWVIKTALRQCRAWRDAGLVVPVAVNLSTRNLLEADLVETILHTLQSCGLPPSALQLEITESSLMANPDRALNVLTQLNDLGISISVDDFGTGYSSLAYLKDLPVHELKIDRSFVRDVLEQPRNLAIVQSTIDLAHHLGLRVVAKGVEDHGTWELLGQVGCDTAQGYYLSRPVAGERLLEWRPTTAALQPLDRAA